MPERDPEARRIARYVDRLMAAGSAAQDAVSDALTDPASRAAARRLRAELVRVHPSFTFEEELSGRLRAAASAMHEQRGATEGYSGTVIRIAIPAPDGALRGGSSGASSGASNGASTDLAVPDLATSPDLALSPDLAESPEAGAWRRLRAARPYIVGGVAASAALCGAFVAWRATRPSGLASAASVASSVISAAAESRASAKIAVAAEGPLHRGRGSAVIHGLLGVVY